MRVLRYVQKCIQLWKSRKFVKIVKSAKLISLRRIWLKKSSNLSIPPSWFSFDEFDCNVPKSSNPWTFTRFREISSNLPSLLLCAFLDISGWIWVRVLAQESVHLSDILLSYFKTIHISIMIAYTEHRIQLSGTGNYRRLKKLSLRSLGERTDNAYRARYKDHQ